MKKLGCYNKIKGGSEELECDSRRVGCASRRDEGFKAEGEACKPLPLLDGRVWQLENGTCIYEGWTFDLSEEEKKESSRAMGPVQRTS